MGKARPLTECKIPVWILQTRIVLGIVTYPFNYVSFSFPEFTLCFLDSSKDGSHNFQKPLRWATVTAYVSPSCALMILTGVYERQTLVP